MQNSKNNLTKNLIEHMFSNFGFISPPLFGKVGLSEKALKTKESISLKYDDVERQYPIYAGEINLQDGTLRAVGLYISFEDDPPEFIVLFRMGDLEINAIKRIDDEFLFLRSSNGVDWDYASVYEQLMACAGLEHISDVGYTWEPTSAFVSLLNPLKHIIEI